MNALREMNKALVELDSAAEIVAEFVDDIALEDLPDLGAELKRAVDKANKALSDIKARIVDSGQSEIKGAYFRATVSQTVRWSLDSSAIKAEMPEDWVNARSKQSLVKSVSFKI